MRTYIGLCYAGYALVVSAVMALVTTITPMADTGGIMPLGEAATRALFWSTPVAVWWTNRDMRQRNVWALADNLRVHRAGALALPAGIQLLLWALCAATLR